MDNANRKFSKLELLSGVVGLLPIPLFSEAAMGYFFYGVVRGTPLRSNPLTNILNGAGMTVFIKAFLYFQMPIYKSAYDNLLDLIK